MGVSRSLSKPHAALRGRSTLSYEHLPAGAPWGDATRRADSCASSGCGWTCHVRSWPSWGARGCEKPRSQLTSGRNGRATERWAVEPGLARWCCIEEMYGRRIAPSHVPSSARTTPQRRRKTSTDQWDTGATRRPGTVPQWTYGRPSTQNGLETVHGASERRTASEGASRPITTFDCAGPLRAPNATRRGNAVLPKAIVHGCTAFPPYAHREVVACQSIALLMHSGECVGAEPEPAHAEWRGTRGTLGT